MANNVFVNGREISCKAGDGKSNAAFPDVCFTPPDKVPPTPPGVPVPYPNFSKAKDLAKGSKTVKVSGKPVMLKNVSYFKTSTGNEAAKPTAKKGIVSSKVQGKTFAVSWSMNVKVEGKNVVRHMDLMTHNHGSMPGNTPPWVFLDTADMNNASDDCKEETKKTQDCIKKHSKKVTRDGADHYNKQKKDFCADDDCKKTTECNLVPYEWGCCDNKTPHHVVPAHCFWPPGTRTKAAGDRTFYPGCQGYDDKQAPCICLDGATKSSKKANGQLMQHGRVHILADAAEDKYMVNGKAGSWKLREANEAGCDAVTQVKQKCDKECMKAQSEAAHKKMDINSDTPLRADSSGQKTPKGFVPQTVESDDMI